MGCAGASGAGSSCLHGPDCHAALSFLAVRRRSVVSRPELIGADHKYCNAYERHGRHACAIDAALTRHPEAHAPR